MRKVIALLEVLGVFLVGSFAAGYLGSLLGVKSIGSIIQFALNPTEPDFIALSVLWLQAICVQYACLLLPAFAIGWWRRRWGWAHYGITKAGKSARALIVFGLMAFTLVALPHQLLWVAKRFIPLGPEPAVWALLTKNWTFSFWLFLAVSSFAFNPILEELFFRGYCQTRLEEDFGGIGAIVIVALFMTLGHNQYHQWNILSIGTIVTLLPVVLGLGYVFWRTRSIFPAVILHGAINLPTKGICDFLLPVAMVAVLVLFRQSWWKELQVFCRELAGKGWKGPALAGSLFAVTMVIGLETASAAFIPLGGFCLGVALIAEFRDRRLSAGSA